MTIALLLFFLPLLSVTSASGDGVHDILKEYGLPKGLLPHSKHHSFSDGDGELVVELKAPCYVQSSDIIYYDRIITGKLSYGAISDISGIQVKKLFVWFPVSAIEAHPDSGTVEFKVTFLSFSYSSKEFSHTPDCMKGAATLAGAEELLRDTEVGPVISLLCSP
ncbi:hypothetical protein Cni_G28163 [Canna indica]|uniref:Uncharacterized protein n=1 Tax=Canna indica TaxID=4628 RepID=A0AAQ3QSW8_9LILI|nr:hypothetical protein Cni_G28163 [Canna indica]